ncbi:peptide deformylase [Gemmiger sp.]
MVRPLMTDVVFLAQNALPATAEDIPVADDLLDTLRAHADGCVGMAANMIGVNKAIIVFDNDGTLCEMFNPVILYRKGLYLTEEGCLSLQGQRKTKRHKTIKVQWQDRAMQTHVKNFTGWTAQIIQHEVDHCSGIII